MIIIHAYINVKLEMRKAFLDHAKNIIPASQNEEGNISYNLYEDTREEAAFVFLEKWKDQTAIEIHEDTVHFKQFIGELDSFLREPIHVDKYEV
ncbi:putative quinol monooxygenase [Domibacillus tundrae]|uniref:putative quinol monooxygenase n=1 Tax=Domibacillus tundrae TaxID=1587527 RepID=UPI003396F0AB